MAENHTRESSAPPGRPSMHPAPKKSIIKQPAVLTPNLFVSSQKKQMIPNDDNYEFLGCINSVEDMDCWSAEILIDGKPASLKLKPQSWWWEKAWRKQRNSNLQRNLFEDQVTLLSTSWVLLRDLCCKVWARMFSY